MAYTWKALGFRRSKCGHLNLWTEQLRATETELRLELALTHTEDRILQVLQQALENFDTELTHLMAERDGVIAWLNKRTPQNIQQEEFPRPETDVGPASSRLAELEAVLQAELEALPAALIIVGERGSGKTSLINCALKRWLNDLEVISGALSDRLFTDVRLQDFLARLVGADDRARLASVLAERRLVIILEELERTFLRQVGYYGAIRGLQRLIAATCSSTLWIISVNQVAFRFLDASVNLGRSFSHRIYAGTANRNDLQQAIMLRHNLSGLRAQFPEPRSPQNLASRLKRSMQGPAIPESTFFDALARESAGIYRTAFDIWVGQVEAIHAGALYLKPFAIRDLSAITEDLSLDQLFTLTAILQHGGLTPEEHAIVFQRGIAASRSRTDELLAREIIEADPDRPGFRVRPEAMPIIKDALYRRNLL